MGLGCSGQIGGLGDNPFGAIASDIGLLLKVAGVSVIVTRHDPQAEPDIYGEPQDTPTPFTVKVIVAKQELKEAETIAGGKRNEDLTILGQPGTLRENDIVSFNGHLYDVRQVVKTSVQGTVVAESYVASSQTDVT